MAPSEVTLPLSPINFHSETDISSTSPGAFPYKKAFLCRGSNHEAFVRLDPP